MAVVICLGKALSATVRRRHLAGRAGALLAVMAGTLIASAAPGTGQQTAGSSRDVAVTWGLNQYGQLGDGTHTGSSTPLGIALPAGQVVTAVTGGEGFSLALSNDGRVWAWGHNIAGQLGDGTTTDSSVPAQVHLPPGVTVTAIAAGRYHSLALTSAGQVWAWGAGDDGQLGDGATTDSSVPAQVRLPPGVTVTAIAAGGYHSLAATSDGQVLAWGNNNYGQLGDGTDTSSNIPAWVRLTPGVIATAIAAGGYHSLAATSDGQVLAWGDNSNGQLGDGTDTGSNIPASVRLTPGVTVTAIAAGFVHSLAVTPAGRVLAWGSNNDGQLGDGTDTSSGTPVEVLLPHGATVGAVGGGYFHSLALTSAGRVLAWGDNSNGQLGDGTDTSSTVPVEVRMPARIPITAIGTGAYFHSLAVATVTPAPTTTTLAASPYAQRQGGTVTLATTVRCQAAGIPTGQVTFRAGPTTLGTAPLHDGLATVTVTSLPAGPNTITAGYQGNERCAPSASEPVTVTIIPAPAPRPPAPPSPTVPVTG